MNTQTQIPLDALSTEDLQRLVEVAQLVSAARDALSDEIVTRTAGAMSEGLTLLDRLTRNQGMMHLLKVLDRQETQNLLIALSDAFYSASREIAAAAPATGGLSCMIRVVRDPGVQEGIRLMSVIGKHMSHSLREQHRRDG
ncbi:MAG TPA: hypothetical protein PKC12_02700 [Thiobacillaceae bacterium]|nr:hypothetical protein [Thiobacillaceae bacterium]